MKLLEKDILELPYVARGNLVNSLSGFKSAGLIGTVNGVGQENLTLVSSAVHLGADPPLMGFVFRPNTVPRHGFETILQTGKFSFNHVHESFYRQAHQSSAKYDRGISEFDAVALSSEYLEGFAVPFVKEAVVKLAMRLVRVVDIEENGTHFLIAGIEAIWFPDAALMDDKVLDLAACGTVAISSLNGYFKASLLSREPYPRV